MSQNQPIISPRLGLLLIRARYDDGAMAAGVWEVAKALQSHLAWVEHIQRARLRDRSQAHLGQQAERLPSRA